MTLRTLRVGIAGANPTRGWARDAHIPALRAIAGFEIVAVSARTREIAEASASAFGGQGYDDSLALARDPDVDIVSVCVKVPEHLAIVLAALDAGKHVYCEWPLGRDVAEAQRLEAAARAAGTHVMIGLQGAHADTMDSIVDAIATGEIGAPLSLNMVSPTAGWGPVALEHHAYLQDRSNGATLSSIAGGHSMAAIERLVGAYVDLSVAGSTQCQQVAIHGGNREIERTGFDHLVIIGRHISGCVSTLEVVGGTTTTAFRLDLRGTEGAICMAGGHVGGYQAGKLVVKSGHRAPAAAVDDTDLPSPAVNVAMLYAKFAADIRTGTRTVPDFSDAARLHHLLDRVEVAAETGQRTPA